MYQKITYHVLVYARNTVRYLERFGMDRYAEEYVENSLARIKAILTSGEFMYRRLREEFYSLEKEIRNLSKTTKPSDATMPIS